MEDRASFFFLLHFWSYVAQIYQPTHVDAKDRPKLHGYAIAIGLMRLRIEHLALKLRQMPRSR